VTKPRLIQQSPPVLKSVTGTRLSMRRYRRRTILFARRLGSHPNMRPRERRDVPFTDIGTRIIVRITVRVTEAMDATIMGVVGNIPFTVLERTRPGSTLLAGRQSSQNNSHILATVRVNAETNAVPAVSLTTGERGRERADGTSCSVCSTLFAKGPRLTV
jgi:hypothetical protein